MNDFLNSAPLWLRLLFLLMCFFLGLAALLMPVAVLLIHGQIIKIRKLLESIDKKTLPPSKKVTLQSDTGWQSGGD